MNEDAVGKVGYVTDAGDGLIGAIGLINDAGGSSELPAGRYRVEVTRAWHDYEIGWRAEGLLVEDTDVQIAKATAATEHPFVKRDLGDPRLNALVAGRMRDPLRHRRVLFALEDFEAEPTATPMVAEDRVCACRTDPEDHDSFVVWCEHHGELRRKAEAYDRIVGVLESGLADAQKATDRALHALEIEKARELTTDQAFSHRLCGCPDRYSSCPFHGPGGTHYGRDVS